MFPSCGPEPILKTSIIIEPSMKNGFIAWSQDFHKAISSASGFKGLEISSPIDGPQQKWIIVEQFHDVQSLTEWQNSSRRQELIEKLKTLSDLNVENPFHEETGGSDHNLNQVTEVFVTQVVPEKDEIYHEWLAKIHAVEATFPGFRGVYVQSPQKGHTRHWMTFLQFDSQENLDNWLTSPERKKVLDDAKSFIESIENHRLISPFGGWFATAEVKGEAPSIWKQTMLVLLVLFPIVVLEIKYLSPLLSSFHSSLATFIGNAISVSLIAWPLMPIAIYFLGWWLKLGKNHPLFKSILGACMIIILYVMEIYLFWDFI